MTDTDSTYQPKHLKLENIYTQVWDEEDHASYIETGKRQHLFVEKPSLPPPPPPYVPSDQALSTASIYPDRIITRENVPSRRRRWWFRRKGTQ